jgi:hypothetical protein
LPARDSIFVKLGYHRYQVGLDDALIGREEAKVSHPGSGDDGPGGGIAQGWAKRGDLGSNIKSERDDLENRMGLQFAQQLVDRYLAAQATFAKQNGY